VTLPVATSIEFRINPRENSMSFYFNNYTGNKNPNEVILFKVPLSNFKMNRESDSCSADMDQNVFLQELKKTWIKPDCFCGLINDFGKHFIPSSIRIFESID
jgi:hypothetical protein